MSLAKMEIKGKDLAYIVITVIVLAVAGTLGYRQLTDANNKGVTVEVVKPVGAQFNTSALDHIRNDEVSKNFVVPLNIGTGVGTSNPFGQL